MDDQNRNLILASVLSFLVIVVWFIFFPPPEPVQQQQDAAIESTSDGSALPSVDTEQSASAPAEVTSAEEAPRIAISNDKLRGTISLTGGRIDDLSLLD